MKKIFFINLKANLTTKQTKDYFEIINKEFKTQNNHFVFFINHLSAYLSFNNYKFNLGIQSFFENDLGPLTSCNTLEQIKEFTNLKYCLLGHCEELKNHKLSLKEINQKIKYCLKTNLVPVVCFGEDVLENQEITLNKLIDQINLLLHGINDYKELILAYEPKYAVNNIIEIIPEKINELFTLLKNKLFKTHSRNFKICYGGNVNQTNINSFMKQKNIDGFLIGRYGLKKENITKMNELNK